MSMEGMAGVTLLQTAPLGVTVIRGGTSRGIFLRADDLPTDAISRDRMLLRLFGGHSGEVADGLGGESVPLRKIAVISPDPVVPGRLRYDFAQVNNSITALDRSVECGNIAAGVPLFGGLCGWTPPPIAGQCVEMLFANTGQIVGAEWLETTRIGGRLRLVFKGIGQSASLPLGEPRSTYRVGNRTVHYSVIAGANTYLLVPAEDLGVTDPCSVSATDPAVWELLDQVANEAGSRLPAAVTLKVCLIRHDSENANAVSARIYYPEERRTHPALAVTGAVTVALARYIDGTVVHERSVVAPSHLTVRHPSGTVTIGYDLGDDGVLEALAVERTCRLIAQGLAY